MGRADLKSTTINLETGEAEEIRRPPLGLGECVLPARKVFQDESIDEDDIECMAYSLIEQVRRFLVSPDCRGLTTEQWAEPSERVREDGDRGRLQSESTVTFSPRRIGG